MGREKADAAIERREITEETEVRAPSPMEDVPPAPEDVTEPGEVDPEVDDSEEEPDGDEGNTINVVVNVDIDQGENHNADNGSVTTVGGVECEYESDEADDGTPVMDASQPRHAAETFFTRNATAEWRDSGKGEEFRTLQGYAAIFDSPSEDLGGFREVLAPGCFTRALESPDLSCHLLWNHDPSTVFASTRNGTLELVQDGKGLRMWARVDMQDPDAQRVVGKVRSGLVDQMSFAFTVSDEGEEWEMRDGKPWRTISQVSGLYDASVVTEPAYRATKVEVLERALRSGRVPQARASVAQDDPAGTTSSLTHEGEALRLLKARAKSRLHIVKFDLKR